MLASVPLSRPVASSAIMAGWPSMETACSPRALAGTSADQARRAKLLTGTLARLPALQARQAAHDLAVLAAPLQHQLGRRLPGGAGIAFVEVDRLDGDGVAGAAEGRSSR